MIEQEAADSTNQRSTTDSAALNTINSNTSNVYETLRYPTKVIYYKLGGSGELGIIYL